MAKTVPGRRVVVASDAVKQAAQEAENPYERDLAVQPETKVRPQTRKLSYKERLQRRLEMADMALVKYEERLEAGGYLEPEEERLFLAHQDSIRKLEATLAQLEAKDNSGDTKTDQQLVVDLLDAGWELEDALRAFGHNPHIRELVSEALSERE